MKTRNKAIIITSCILLVVALAVFLTGGWLAGWDFVAFFKSPLFVWICVIVGLYFFAIIAFLVFDKIRRL